MHVIGRCLAFAVLLVLASLAPARAQSPAASPKYVGSAVCAECHGDISERWSRSHHALAWTMPDAGAMQADFDGTSFAGAGMNVEFRRGSDGYSVRVTEADGLVREYPIHSVVGIEPLQQYLIETEPGRLQSFDVVWDVGKRTWYHLYPGDVLKPGDALHWTGTYKNWNSRCAECHATGFRKRYDPAARRYYSRWAEIGVGCESCHGPGSAHVALTRDGAQPAGTEGVDAKGFTVAFDPANAEREIQQCAGCHSRREAASDGNPLPGTPYHDAYRLSVLTPGLYHADGQMNDEVYVYGSFLQSKMYARGVRCSDCHDPHGADLKAEGNVVCTQCHSPAGNPRFPTLRRAEYDAPAHHFHAEGSQGAQCRTCHMPEKVYMGIDGRRDHSFRVPRPDLSAQTGAPDACTSCHTGQSPDWAAAEIAKRFPEGRHLTPQYGQVLAPAWERPGENNPDLVALALDETQAGIVRATALELLGNQGDEATAAAVEALLADPDPLVRAYAAAAQRPVPPDIRVKRLSALLSDPAKMVRFAAVRALLDVSGVKMPPEEAAPFNAAFNDWQASLATRLDFPETQIVLGGIALTTRNLPAAAAAFREVVRLDPQHVDAWIMLIRIAAASGGAGAAATVAEQARVANPASEEMARLAAELKQAAGQ